MRRPRSGRSRLPSSVSRLPVFSKNLTHFPQKMRIRKVSTPKKNVPCFAPNLPGLV